MKVSFKSRAVHAVSVTGFGLICACAGQTEGEQAMAGGAPAIPIVVGEGAAQPPGESGSPNSGTPGGGVEPAVGAPGEPVLEQPVIGAPGEPEAEQPAAEPPPGSEPSAPGCDDIEPRATGYRTLRPREVREVLTASFGELAQSAEPAFALLGEDELVESVLAYDALPSDAHARFVADIAQRMAEAIDEEPALGANVCLSAPEPTDECLKETFRKWWLPIHHQQPTEDELAALLDTARNESLGAVVAELVLDPALLLLVQLGAETSTTGTRVSVAKERAAFLSFALTGQPPIAEFLAAVEAAADDEQKLTQALAPLLASAAFEAKLDELLTLYIGDRGFPSMQGPADLFGDLGPEVLQAEARQELRLFLKHVTTSEGDQLHTLFTSPLVFPPGEQLASLLGLDAPAPGGVELAQRPGLLFRPAVLAEGKDHTSPILRGLFVLEQLLCIELPVPDPNLVQEVQANNPTDPLLQSTRERTHVSTSDPVCAGCHQVINSFGFAMEGFDPIGRERTTEVVFDATGAVLATHAIDAVTEVATLPPARVRSAAELSFALAADRRTAECFAQRAIELISLQHRHLPCTAEAAAASLGTPEGTLAGALTRAAMEMSRARLVVPEASAAMSGGGGQ